MEYRGYDICFHQPLLEKQDIDEKGNATHFRDSWHNGTGFYVADDLSAPDFDGIKALIDKRLGRRVIFTVEIEATVQSRADMGEFLNIALHHPDWESIRITDCVITKQIDKP